MADKTYTITITFKNPEFTYSCEECEEGKKEAKNIQPGRKHKVYSDDGNNTVEWKSKNNAWAIRFDGSTPLKQFAYRGAANIPAGDKIDKNARGRFKYWVAVLDNDQVYLDDPDMIVEP